MQKKVFWFVVVSILTFVLGGCSTKNVVQVQLKPYKPAPRVYKKSGVVYFSGVVDRRKNKKTIGVVVKDGKAVTKVVTDQNLAKWFKEALVKALGNEGCKVTRKSTHADKIARIYVRIDKAEAKLDVDKLTGENLTASVYVTLFMRQGKSDRIIKKIGLTQKKWVPPLMAEKEIKSYLQETLEEVVNMVLDHIDTYRF